MAKKKLSSKSNYVPNRMINEIEVERNGKTTYIDGANVLDGMYVKKGIKFGNGGGTAISSENGGYTVGTNADFSSNQYQPNTDFALMKNGGGVGKEKVWEVVYFGEKHLSQRGSRKGNYKTWVVANSREEAIKKVKDDDEEFAELKSAKPTSLDVERYKYAKGGGIKNPSFISLYKGIVDEVVKQTGVEREKAEEIVNENKAWLINLIDEEEEYDVEVLAWKITTTTNEYAKGGGVGNEDTPKVWIGEWSLYNEGKLIGEWVDLSDYSSGEEVMDKIQELLDKWTEETGDTREEYGVFDYENFPRSMYSEQMGEQEFDNVIKAWEFSQERDVPMEVIGTIVSEYSPSDIGEWFDEHYEGKFDSDSDLAYHYVDMVGGLQGLGKETVERYFDYDSFGRDLAYDYSEYDGHYFRTYKRGGVVGKFDLKNYLTKGGFKYTIGGL